MQNPGSDAGVFVWQSAVDSLATPAAKRELRCAIAHRRIHSSKYSWRSKNTVGSGSISTYRFRPSQRINGFRARSPCSRPGMTEECTRQRCRGFCLRKVSPGICSFPSVADLNQSGSLLLPSQFSAGCFFCFFLRIGDEEIRLALKIRHQLHQDGIPGLFAFQRVSENAYR